MDAWLSFKIHTIQVKGSRKATQPLENKHNFKIKHDIIFYLEMISGTSIKLQSFQHNIYRIGQLSIAFCVTINAAIVHFYCCSKVEISVT